MDVLNAVKDFLQRDKRMNDKVREKGRKIIRDLVGWRIFDFKENRRGVPRGVHGAVAITLEQTSEIIYSSTSHPQPLYAPFVDIKVWARDTNQENGAALAREVIDGLRMYLTQYAGPLNDDVEAQTIKLEGGPIEFAEQPRDASGNWTYRYFTTWMIGVPIEMPTGAD